ncbi:MAG: dihydrofolate reductase [Ignavibacteriales bacterium]|nr:dihydrofolate reductase [Ignavibacteriales bacterium]
MKLTIIAALNRKRVIGRGGTIPWHIPADLKRFKELTMGNTVVMGRKTFESIGKILPGRRNVVVTSQTLPDVEHYHSLEEAMNAVRSEERVFVIGGGTIFEQTIGRADEMVLTRVDNAEDGDTLFPMPEEYLDQHFVLIREEPHGGFTFQHFSRK